MDKYYLEAVPGDFTGFFFLAKNFHQCLQHITPPLIS
jgi:hypothetical protein